MGVPPSTVDALASDQRFFFTDRAVFSREILEEAARALQEFVEGALVNSPTESGVQLGELRGALDFSSELVDEALRMLGERESLEIEGAVVRTAGWKPRLSTGQSDLAERMVHVYCSSGEEPPTLGEVVKQHGEGALPVLRFLEREGRLIRISGDFYYCPDVVDRMVGRLAGAMEDGREYSPADVKDAVGTSRKYLIPFLEFCDRTRVTERKGAGRVLRNRQLARP